MRDVKEEWPDWLVLTGSLERTTLYIHGAQKIILAWTIL